MVPHPSLCHTHGRSRHRHVNPFPGKCLGLVGPSIKDSRNYARVRCLAFSRPISQSLRLGICSAFCVPCGCLSVADKGTREDSPYNCALHNVRHISGDSSQARFCGDSNFPPVGQGNETSRGGSLGNGCDPTSSGPTHRQVPTEVPTYSLQSGERFTFRDTIYRSISPQYFVLLFNYLNSLLVDKVSSPRFC